MLNYQNITRRLLALVSTLIFSYVYINIFFDSVNQDRNIVIVSVMFFVTLFLLFTSYIDRRTFYSALSIMFVIQLFFGYFLMVEYGTWDVYAVTKNARALITGEYFNSGYFATYPNNIAILLFFRLVFCVCNELLGTTSNYILVILNILAIDISILFAVRFSRIVYGEKIAYRAGIMMTWFAPFYLYVPICYTDTFSLPFVTGLICWFVSCMNKKQMKSWRKYINLFGIGSFLFLGYKLKGSLIVLFIAMLIYVFIQFPFRTFYRVASGLLFGFITASLLWSFSASASDLVDDKLYETYQFPVTHWVMMGLTGSGNYNADDVNFTRSFPTYQEKKDATVQNIADRVREKGFFGTIKHCFNKAIKYAWNFGTCYAERYLGDFGDMPKIRNILHEFVLSNGSYHKILYVVTQSIWLVYFGLTTFSFVTEVCHGVLPTFFLRITLVGCMVFFMLWETHPRYILNYTPIVILIAAIAMDKISNDIVAVTGINLCRKVETDAEPRTLKCRFAILIRNLTEKGNTR